MRPNLITRLKEEWNNLDPVDPLRGLIADAIDALAEQPASKPWVGLTAMEIEAIGKPYEEKDRSIRAWGLFACAIEAKLKEKNT